MEERYLNPHTDFGFKRLLEPEDLKTYEDSVNAYRDIVNAIKTAEKKKYAEGKAEGRAEGRAEERAEIVQKMLAKGMNTEDVAELTGLSTEEIRKLIK